jgi:predicted metalloprotease with PDZ domain
MWLGEGIPSYVEPIARVRAGLLTPRKLWRDLVEGLPQGLPETGDQGLERTHTWGRTYWGGTLFCLLADVTIRERTGNTRSFDDVLRAFVATGQGVEAHWSIDEMLDRGDEATGTTVLRELYRTMGSAPSPVDLQALWKRLGVQVVGDGVGFDDSAPLAAVRRGIAGL